MGLDGQLFDWVFEAGKGFLRRRYNGSYDVVDKLELLFEKHGLDLKQHWRWLPREWGWTAATVRDSDSIQLALTAEVLEWMATTFGVRPAWLTSRKDEQIYDRIYGYKRPYELVRSVGQMVADSDTLNCKAYFDHRVLPDRSKSGRQEIALVFRVPIFEDREGEHNDNYFRTIVCGDQWDWAYPQCRADLKAFVRWWWTDQRLGPIDLIATDSLTIQHLRDGLIFESDVKRRRCATDDRHVSLEDFVLAMGTDRVSERESSCKAKETEELESVLEYKKRMIDDYVDKESAESR